MGVLFYIRGMKKLILLLLFIPLVSFGQDETNVEVNVNTGIASQFADRGLKNLGKGIYSITQVGSSGFVSLKKLEKRARQEIINFSTSNKYNWEIITVEHLGLEDIVDVFPKVIITFQITNQDGSAVLGIISQEEFDERAEPLKKIILD